MQNVTPIAIAALGLELVPAVLFALAAERVARAVGRWPVAARMVLPAVLVTPYGLVSISGHMFRWRWFALYAALLQHAAAADPASADPAAPNKEQRGDLRD